jgi:hypothetical protein
MRKQDCSAFRVILSLGYLSLMYLQLVFWRFLRVNRSRNDSGGNTSSGLVELKSMEPSPSDFASVRFIVRPAELLPNVSMTRTGPIGD